MSYDLSLPPCWYFRQGGRVYGLCVVGNIVTRGADTFTCNARSRMVQVNRNGSVISQYQHNGKGERVIKSAGGNTVHFVYDLMGNIIAEADSAGIIQREYVYVNGERLALMQQSPTQATYYYHNDHLGTPKALTNATGTVVWQADYTPFGELSETVSVVEQPFRFPGQYFDGETGVYYNYFRDYDPGLGRYVQSDPIGLDGGINTFGYVGGNSITFFDFFGLRRVNGGHAGAGQGVGNAFFGGQIGLLVVSWSERGGFELGSAIIPGFNAAMGVCRKLPYDPCDEESNDDPTITALAGLGVIAGVSGGEPCVGIGLGTPKYGAGTATGPVE